MENGLHEATDETIYNALTQAKFFLLKHNRKKDSKSIFYIFQVVRESVFPRIAKTIESKQAWDILKTTYQGMIKVKTTKLQMLRRDFETIFIKESKTINSFFTQLIGLDTQIKSHGETLKERRKI